MKVTALSLVAGFAVVATASTALFLSIPLMRAEDPSCPPGFVLKDPLGYAREVRPTLTDDQAARIREQFGTQVCLAAKHPEPMGELMTANEQLAMAWGAARPGALREALAQKEAMIAAGATATVPNADGAWEMFGVGPLITDDPRYESVNGLGIGKNSGRVDSMDYDPVNKRVFASIGTGGVWMSENLADRWESIGEALPTQIIGAVAWTSAGGGTLIAGSGEPLNGGNTYVGMGAFWTDDLGATWNQATGVPDGAMTYQVEVDPGHPEIVYVATSKGLYRSTDAGRTYVDVRLPTSPDCTGVYIGACQFANYVTDVVVKEPGGSTNVVCLATGCPVLAAVGFRNGKRAYLDGKPHAPRNGLYRSDTGAPDTYTWLNASGDGASNVGFALEDHIGRVELGNAIGTAQDHNYVYAIVQDAVLLNGGVAAIDVADDAPVGAPVVPTVLNGIYVSPDFGSSWIRMADENEITYNTGTGSSLQGVGVALGVGPGVQAWYNMYITPDPTRQDALGVPTRLIFGLEEVWTNRTPDIGLNGVAQQGTNDFKVIGGYYAGTSCLLLDTGVPVCPASDTPTEHTTTHPDQHEGLWIPDATGGGVTFLAGNDGGVYRQHAAAGEEMDNSKWGEGHNTGFYTLLPYSGAVADDCTVWFGLQDNGSGKIEPGSRQIFETIGGDGTISAVDPANPDIAYIQIQNGSLRRTTDGGRSWATIKPSQTSAPLFVNPLAMDPTDAKHLMTGGPQIAEQLDAPNATTGSWTTVFNLGNAPNSTAARRMTAVDLQGDAAYVGYCGLCNVFTTRTALNQEFDSGIATNVSGAAPAKRGTSDGWHFATGAGLPNRYVTAIEIDPADPETVYVSLGMYENRQWAPPGQYLDPNTNIGTGHVFKSMNAGEAFVDISGNLPDVPVFWVTLRGGQLLAGTQIGPFISSDLEGTEWAPLGTGLPNTPIAQLATSPGDLTQMFAATFGRGIWRYRFPGEPDICIAPVAPVQGAPTVETPAPSEGACGTDTDGDYALNFTYPRPTGGVDPVAFDIQEATIFEDVFFDDADESLSGGSNSTWQGTSGWSTQVNPNTGSPAYYAPATMDQVDTLTMIDALDVPAGSATLSFDTTQSTEACCDFVSIEVSTDDGANFTSIASWSGDFLGLRHADLSPFTGHAIKLRFKITADQLVPGPGVYIENIRINAGNFTTIGEAPGASTTHAITGRDNGTRHYRIAGLFGSTLKVGPYSNVRCVVTDIPNTPPTVNVGSGFAIDEGASGMLSGTASDAEGGTLTYAWTQVSPANPTAMIDNPDMATTSFTAPAVGADTTIKFRLTVTDPQGASGAGDINVVVRQVNAPPVASAGTDFAVDEGAGAMLSGAGSSDADGDTLTYQWTQTAGPTVALTGANSATASFTAPDVGADTPLTFSLRVNDPAGANGTDVVIVTVRALGVQAVIGNNSAGAPSPLLLLGLLLPAALCRRRR